MSEEIDHTCTDEIVCPYCGQEVSDSWELSDDHSSYDCCNCDKQFSYSREVSVTYSTSKMCEENGFKHKWGEVRKHRSEYFDGMWLAARHCSECEACSLYDVDQNTGEILGPKKRGDEN